MLSEHPDSSDRPPEKRRPQPDFLGSPTEYADAQEVPESLNILAKVLAGGALTWGVLIGVIALLGFGCAIFACLGLWFLR